MIHVHSEQKINERGGTFARTVYKTGRQRYVIAMNMIIMQRTVLVKMMRI